nr:unnamed protein product [Callosobruchus analis]
MKYYAAGDGLLNSAINNLPFEMHIPGYSWCGPGTKNDPGVNGLDEACKEHDILYANESDLTKRHAADEVLARKAMKRFSSKDASWKEKIAALGVAGAMKAKVKLVHKRCVKKLQKVQLELGTAIEQMKDSLQVVQEKMHVKINTTTQRQQQQQRTTETMSSSYARKRASASVDVNSFSRQHGGCTSKKSQTYQTTPTTTTTTTTAKETNCTENENEQTKQKRLVLQVLFEKLKNTS